MNIEEKKGEDFIVLKPLSRNIDVTVSTQFKGKVVDLINQGNHFFILNLSQVEFVDSSGLGAMISILKTLKQSNGDIILCELKNPVMNLLNLTRLSNVFKICSNENEASKSLLSTKKS